MGRHRFWVQLPESLRYMDIHSILPEDSPAELKTAFDALLASLLLNSSLAAIKIQPKSVSNAVTAIGNTTRALNKLQLNDADKGQSACTHGWTLR